jgi:hypothetical protein
MASKERIDFILLYPEDGDDKFLRNVDNNVQDFTVS